MTIGGTHNIAGMDSRYGMYSTAGSESMRPSRSSLDITPSYPSSSSSSLRSHSVSLSPCFGWAIAALVASIFMITFGCITGMFPLTIAGGVLFAAGVIGMGFGFAGIKPPCC
jgi:hypothetical protein